MSFLDHKVFFPNPISAFRRLMVRVLTPKAKPPQSDFPSSDYYRRVLLSTSSDPTIPQALTPNQPYYSMSGATEPSIPVSGLIRGKSLVRYDDITYRSGCS